MIHPQYEWDKYCGYLKRHVFPQEDGLVRMDYDKLSGHRRIKFCWDAECNWYPSNALMQTPTGFRFYVTRNGVVLYAFRNKRHIDRIFMRGYTTMDDLLPALSLAMDAARAYVWCKPVDTMFERDRKYNDPWLLRNAATGDPIPIDLFGNTEGA